MRLSSHVVRFLLFLVLTLLLISLGLCYYYGATTEYVFEVYLFMTAASLVWAVFLFSLLFFLQRLSLSKRQEWILKHGHIAIAKITSTYTTETKTSNNKTIYHIHNIVQTTSGLMFTIDYEPRLKTEENYVIIRFDEDTAVFDNRIMHLLYKKKITEATLGDYIDQNENYKPTPEDISESKKTIFSKKFVFILLGIIILGNYITPTVIIGIEKATATEVVPENTHWSTEIKTKSLSIFGFELPEYNLEYTGSYYVTDAKQRLYDSNLNSGYLYPNASEFSFHFLSVGPSNDKLSSYASYLVNSYGFTKNYDIMDLDCYDNISYACSEINPVTKFHYIQLKKDNLYIIITSSYRNGYYTYMNYAAELKKDVWITCVKL